LDDDSDPWEDQDECVSVNPVEAKLVEDARRIIKKVSEGGCFFGMWDLANRQFDGSIIDARGEARRTEGYDKALSMITASIYTPYDASWDPLSYSSTLKDIESVTDNDIKFGIYPTTVVKQETDLGIGWYNRIGYPQNPVIITYTSEQLDDLMPLIEVMVRDRLKQIIECEREIAAENAS
jgi:hypothetical protein